MSQDRTDRFPLVTPADACEQARDAAFAAFVAQQLTHVDANGCREERKLAAGIRRIFDEWDRTRELARTSNKDELTGRVDALRWALRCMADTAWRGMPGWDKAFDPQSVAPDAGKKAAS